MYWDTRSTEISSISVSVKTFRTLLTRPVKVKAEDIASPTNPKLIKVRLISPGHSSCFFLFSICSNKADAHIFSKSILENAKKIRGKS